MKTHVVLPLALLIGLSGCKKDDSTVVNSSTSETVAATVTEEQGYAYTISSGESVTVMTEAVHASVSKVSSDASGITTYSYVPVAGYTGLDSVVIQVGHMPPPPGCHRPDSSGCHRPDSAHCHRPDSLMPPPDSTRHHPRRPHRRGRKDCDKSSSASEGAMRTVTLRFNVVAKTTGE
jgi:hypothetical protein